MQKICLVAVDIRSTYNVGSLFRTCDGFGADLMLVGISPRPYSKDEKRLPHVAKKADAAIHKTALGAEKNVKWKYFENLSNCIEYLKKQEYKIIAIEQDVNSKNIRKLNVDKPTALVIGTEVTGLKDEEIQMCDEIYEIPMNGKKESFNVSVAAGIALYQACKQLMVK